MESTAITLDRGFGRLRDIDLLADGSWVGVFRTAKGHEIRFGDVVSPAPADLEYPMVRFAGPDRIVLADGRAEKARDNAWVLGPDGNVQASFCAGDGIQDLLATEHHIVATYFDEGVFGDIAPSAEGVAVFDIEGSLAFGYQSELGDAAVDVSDCYCACPGEDDVVWFSAYAGFPLVRLDLARRRQDITALPEELHYASAVSTTGSRFYFYSPDAERDGVMTWRPGQVVRFIGLYPGPLRGLAGGRFLSVGRHGYTIVSPEGTAQHGR